MPIGGGAIARPEPAAMGVTAKVPLCWFTAAGTVITAGLPMLKFHPTELHGV